ncbi:MAG: hypothetical protein EBR01_05300 [Proteobacteria bacterium]|nr:hypothetical protein [Pseudomonadota bacterium]
MKILLSLAATFMAARLFGTQSFSEQLYPKLKQHLSALNKEVNEQKQIKHADQAKKIAEAIAKLHQPGKELPIVLVCTGNSRRSVMGAAMGNASAALLEMGELKFYSGGTAPSAFNSRSIASLKEAGFEIEPTGKLAPAGSKGEENPVYLVKWGKSNRHQMEEFSKQYSDPKNPQKDFIALMVCDDATKKCPVVPGAKYRFSIPFEDPKAFDNTPQEKDMYNTRRDELGRFMLSTLEFVKAAEGGSRQLMNQ